MASGPQQASVDRRDEVLDERKGSAVLRAHMVEEPILAADAQHSTDLAEALLRPLDAAKVRCTDDRVERAVLERQRLRLGPHERYGSSGRLRLRLSDVEHVGVRIERHELCD